MLYHLDQCRGLRGLPAASRCAGPPSRAARPSPLRGPLRGPCPPPAPRRLRRRCSGPPRPHSWGLLGRCGPPARACLAPASRPALARLRLCPRWRGSACARPARRSGPAPLAASRRRAAGRGPRPLGASRARPQFRRRALGPCPLCGSRPLSAPRAAGARGYAACGRVCHVADHPTRPRQAACGGPCRMICAVAQCNQGRCIALKQVSGDNKKTRCPMQRVFCKRQLAGPNRFYAAKTVSTVRRQREMQRDDKGACPDPAARLRRQTSRAGRHRQERT